LKTSADPNGLHLIASASFKPTGLKGTAQPPGQSV